MFFSSLSPTYAAIMVPLLFSLLVPASSTDQKRQASSDDSCDDEAPTSDGPTSDKSAGLGIEFESGAILFTSSGCSIGDTNQAKGKVVGNRKATNWALTADTTRNTAGSLTAEYILDGKVIKIGDGTASAAAAAASSDLLDWKPFKDMPKNSWDIDGNHCNPWKVTNPSVFNPDFLTWAVQATAPLPFEAISDLFAAAIVTPNSPLLPVSRPGIGMVSVTSKFFKSSPNGLSSGSVKQDVLGFLSLVVSYAKQASSTNPPIYSEKSPKQAISIMPRTDFVTLFTQVKTALPGSDTLYNLVKVLACYKNDGDDVRIDPQFCGGTVDAPTPNKYMDGIGWCLKDSSNGNQECLAVSDWIASIQSGPSPDKLTTLDKLIDGQIGGLHTALENVVGTSRGVPIFEFRDLDGVTASKFQTITTEVESELLRLHQKHQSPPSRLRKGRRMMKNGKRQAPSQCPAIISASAIASSTAPPKTAPSCAYHGPDPDGFSPEGWCVCESSVTLSLTTPTSRPAPESASCDYQTLPTSSVSVTKSLPPATTSNCVVYQQVGANEDKDSTVPGCVPTGKPTTNITLSNNKVAAGGQTGQSFHDAILRALKPKCHDVVNGNGTCDSTGADMDNIEYVEKDGGDLEQATLTFTIENGNYRTNAQRDAMLSAVAVSFNASAQGKNCGTVKYNSCKGGQSETSNPNDVSPHGAGCDTPLTQCNIPNLISVTMIDGGVEVGVMLVEASFKINGWSEFDCQLVADIVDAFFATAEVVAPESAPGDMAVIGEMEATCAELTNMAGGHL